MWTNDEILRIAREQSALDICCSPDDFLREENVFVKSLDSPLARKYLKLPFTCQMVSYGSNVVASTSPEMREIAEKYLL